MNKKNYLLNTVLFNLNEVTEELFENLGEKGWIEDKDNVVKSRLVSELLNLGFKLDEPLYKKLDGMSVLEIVAVRERLIELIGLVRGNLTGEVFYPNFPEFVKELTDEDLDRYRFKHYSTTYGYENIKDISDTVKVLEVMFDAQNGLEVSDNSGIIDNYILELVDREESYILTRSSTMMHEGYEELSKGYKEEVENGKNKFLPEIKDYLDNNKYKEFLDKYDEKQTIKFGELSTALTYLQDIINSKSSINEDMVKMIGVITSLSESELEDILPEEITRKEIMAYVVSQLIKDDKKVRQSNNYIKTATDLLRVMDVLNGGDASLKTFNYKKLNRQTRRYIMGLLNTINPYIASEDMFRNETYWNGLVQVIHPFERRFNKYSKSQKAFKLFVKGDKGHTYLSKQTELMKSVSIKSDKSKLEELVKLMKTRPSEFARNVDFLLKHSKGDVELSRDVLSTFDEVIGEVSNLVLHQMNKHFMNYDKSSLVETRLGHHPVNVKEDRLDDYDVFIIQGVINRELSKRFSKESELGKVYLDSQLKQINLPLSLRTSSVKSSNVLTRGSKMPLKGKDKLRLFTRWKNNSYWQHIDVDLSAMFLREDFSKYGEIAYYNQRIGGLDITHSGDITSAPNGAFEFIEVNKKDVLNKGIRYIVMSLIVYSGDNFKGIEESTAGWVEFDADENINMKLHEVATFNKDSLRNQFDIVSDSKSVVPMIVDLEKDMMYWTDIYLTNQNSYQRIEDLTTGVRDIVKYFKETDNLTVYDLINTHIKERNGVEVYDKEDADLVFTLEDLSIPDILSNYL